MAIRIAEVIADRLEISSPHTGKFRGKLAKSETACAEMRQAEDLLKRIAQDDYQTLRHGACRRCKKWPCVGDDRILCVHKNLIADIDAFLKRGEKADG